MIPKKPALAQSASIRAFTPVFDEIWTRVNALMTTQVGFIRLAI